MRASLCSVLVAAVTFTTGCSQDEILDVRTPDIINGPDLDNAQGIQALYAGAVSEFVFQMDNGFGLALVTSLFTDESMHASTPPAVREWDLRNVLPTNTSTPALFLNLQRARSRLEDAAARVGAVAGATDKRVGELLALAGLTYIQLAENYCSGIPISSLDGPTYGAPLSTNEVLDLGLGRLTAAAAATGGDTRIVNLVAVLRGRALLNKNDAAGAATAVAAVPTDFIYQIFHSTTTPRQTNQIVVQFGSDIFSVPNQEGINGINFASAADPRVPIRATGPSRNDGVTPMVQYIKYTSQADPVTIVSGVEARLIEAEAALKVGNTGTWLDKLNVARATVAGLAPLTDPGSANARVDLTFRERGFWFYLTAHRLGDLRRLIRQHGRGAETVFPTGAYHKQGLTRGTQVAFVIPQPEENNPEFDPSACNPATP